MRTRQRVKHVRGIVDILVVDREDRPILLGDVKDKDEPTAVALARIEDFLDFADLAVPLVMLVDHDRIAIYRGDEELRDEPIFSAKTKPILGYYSEYFRDARHRVGKDLLTGLALTWLRDLSYRLRSKTKLPPAHEELDRLGIVELLKHRVFLSEVPFGGYRLHRDESPDWANTWPGS